MKHMGVYGAIATSIITHTVLLLYRLHDMKRYFKLSFYPATSLAVAVMALGIIPYHLLSSSWLALAYMLLASLVAFYSIPAETRKEIKSKIVP